VILDEITNATYLKFLTPEAVLEAIEARAHQVEVVVTGRYCPELLIENADLVTEMKEVKHYYTQGVLSRKGIDC
jgi:cob(I)alamin adenosyltransferase